MLLCITASDKFTEQAVQDLITDFLAPYCGQEQSITKHEQETVHWCLGSSIPVYDLGKGLFPITTDTLHMALSSTETASEGEVGRKGRVEDDDGSPSFSDQLADWTLEELKELEKELRHTISVKENLHPIPYVNGRRGDARLTDPGSMPHFTNENAGAEIEVREKIKCWKNTETGVVRRARKTRAKANEVEVWMTEDEFNNL